MSECIICKGNNQLDALGFSVADADGFLMKGAFWLGGTNNIWTFRYKGKEIDEIITDARSQILDGIQYRSTQFYELLHCLLDNHVRFAMWYDIYTEKLAPCNTKEDVLKTCYEQIMEESGMCEVYIVCNTIEK